MAAPPAPRIGLLGGFRVLDGRVANRLPSARQQQIIAFLVLHARGTPVPRQRVAGSLWPDSGDTQALTNLRRELHHLRDEWPRLEALVEVGPRTLAWSGGAGATIDLLAFEAAADRGLAGDREALRAAARLYNGDLLPDCAGEWIDPVRERLRERARNVLARLASLLEDEKAFGDAIESARHWLHLDPLDERAWCALMRSHARRGDRATALHLYQQCALLLKKELGVQPGAATRATYREILDLDADTPAVPPPPRTAVYPLVGRSAEWRALLDAWRSAEAGRSRLVVIRGEAGIGKSRIAEELVAWCGSKGINAVTARCYAGEARLAYAPIATWLKGDGLRPSLERLDAAWLTDVARLRPDILVARPGVQVPGEALESWQRLRFFESLSQAFRLAAPLLLVLDDLQWADADTLEWLQYFLRSASDARCLVLGTARSEEEQDNFPLGRMLGHLERDDLLAAIALGRLDEAATAALAGEVAEHPLDEAAAVRAFRETEGHPLFIVERGRMDAPGGPEGVGEAAPPHVQAVLAARLELLSPEARTVAEVASALGRDFRFDILARASGLEEELLVRALDELWRRQIVRTQADEQWDFSHDRIREVAYGTIGPARRSLIHRRIARGMESLFAGRLDEASASIAVHLELGGQPARAIPFLERAASVAARVSANEEAIRCLQRALSLLEALPRGGDRDQSELALRSSLSVALNAARGYAAPEVEQNLERVFALLGPAARGEVPVRWIWVAFSLHFVLGDLKGTREFAETAVARSAKETSCRCEAHHAMGAVLSSLGELEASREHFEAALAAYDERCPQRSALGSDLGVFAHAWYAHTLWLLDDECAAVSHAAEAAALARRLDHPYSEALALAYAALLHQLRRDPPGVVVCAEGAVALCERYGFGYYGDWGRVLLGWARALDRPAEGVSMIEASLERLDAQRAHARRPYFLSLLAEAYTLLGEGDRSASLLDAAIAMGRERSDCWWLPALYLQKSELLPPARRRSALQSGLEIARAQKSRALERRILERFPRTLPRTLRERRTS